MEPRGPRALPESTCSLLLPHELLFPIKGVSCTTLGAVGIHWPYHQPTQTVHLWGCAKAFARLPGRPNCALCMLTSDQESTHVLLLP